MSTQGKWGTTDCKCLLYTLETKAGTTVSSQLPDHDILSEPLSPLSSLMRIYSRNPIWLLTATPAQCTRQECEYLNFRCGPSSSSLPNKPRIYLDTCCSVLEFRSRTVSRSPSGNSMIKDGLPGGKSTSKRLYMLQCLAHRCSVILVNCLVDILRIKAWT